MNLVRIKTLRHNEAELIPLENTVRDINQSHQNVLPLVDRFSNEMKYERIDKTSILVNESWNNWKSEKQ